MMMHKVRGIEITSTDVVTQTMLGSVKELYGVRKITIKLEDGQDLQLTLFADETDNASEVELYDMLSVKY
jgi:hypothetical protein